MKTPYIKVLTNTMKAIKKKSFIAWNDAERPLNKSVKFTPNLIVSPGDHLIREEFIVVAHVEGAVIIFEVNLNDDDFTHVCHYIRSARIWA